MRRWLAVCVMGLVGCGGGGGGTPTTPTPPPPAPQVNRAPAVTSVTVTPGFGIQSFGTFTFNASASDPDGDTLTFTWDIAGSVRSGSTAQAGPFANGGAAVAVVTVSDGRGGTATASVEFIVGSMTGTWRGGVQQSNSLPDFTMTLVQGVGGLFVGTIRTIFGEEGQVGPTGAIATITASGQVTMRVKVAPFVDFIMTGQMDGTGERVTGTVMGSGFTGQPFTMLKQ